MKQIKLTKGKFTLVDDEELSELQAKNGLLIYFCGEFCELGVNETKTSLQFCKRIK